MDNILHEISMACRYGNLKEVQRLLSLGVDINSAKNEFCSPLVEACIGEDYVILSFLLENGADPHIHNNYVFYVAAFKKNENILKLLKQYSIMSKLKNSNLFERLRMIRAPKEILNIIFEEEIYVK